MVKSKKVYGLRVIREYSVVNALFMDSFKLTCSWISLNLMCSRVDVDSPYIQTLPSILCVVCSPCVWSSIIFLMTHVVMMTVVGLLI